MARIAHVVDEAILQIRRDRQMSQMIRLLARRKAEFDSQLQINLAGTAMQPQARAFYENKLERAFTKCKADPSKTYDEVIIGGGLHAAIYSAVRSQMGYPAPLVIERGRVGGVFATSLTPAWYLNSRNRRGPGGFPSENANLNYVPAAPVQCSHFCTSEYPTNADMAFIIRTMLALYADLHVGQAVQRVERASEGYYSLFLKDGSLINARRVLDARGLGDPIAREATRSFTEHMASMEKPFPLQNMGRVAVVGGGDSAKTVVESLFGAGPQGHSSVPALDYVEQVDVYAESLPKTCETWRQAIRTRYQALSAFLQKPDNSVQRMRVFSNAIINRTFNGVTVNGRVYDTVILCTGWERRTVYSSRATLRAEGFDRVSRRYSGEEYYVIGPAAEIEFSSEESQSTRSNSENMVAIFRLGPKTAALAARLPSDYEPSMDDAIVLGYDIDGEPLREGDRVSFTDEEGRKGVTGVVVACPSARRYAVKRDDGVRGGGPDGAWLMDSTKDVYRIG